MTRWALIEGTSVVNVVEQDDVPAIDGIWVPCTNAGPGWTYSSGSFLPNDGEAASAPVVTVDKARAAMLAAGLTEEQVAAILAVAAS